MRVFKHNDGLWQERTPQLCVLAVPIYMSVTDFFQFLGPHMDSVRALPLMPPPPRAPAYRHRELEYSIRTHRLCERGAVVAHAHRACPGSSHTAMASHCTASKHGRIPAVASAGAAHAHRARRVAGPLHGPPRARLAGDSEGGQREGGRGGEVKEKEEEEVTEGRGGPLHGPARP